MNTIHRAISYSSKQKIFQAKKTFSCDDIKLKRSPSPLHGQGQRKAETRYLGRMIGDTEDKLRLPDCFPQPVVSVLVYRPRPLLNNSFV